METVVCGSQRRGRASVSSDSTDLFPLALLNSTRSQKETWEEAFIEGEIWMLALPSL